MSVRKQVEEIESKKEIEKLYLYQSDIHYLEREKDSINIFTNDGRIIEIKGEFKITEIILK